MKRLGWGKSGTLTTGKEAQFTSLSASFEEPTTFTVQFDVQQGATAGFAIATVIWTVNGVSFTRTIDVAAGSSISGLAESVRVIVNDATDVTVYPSGVEYVVSVTIAGRPRPTTATPPVFTGLQATSLNTGQTIPVQVPNGANSVAVYGTTNTPGTPVAIQVDMVALTTPGGFDSSELTLSTIAAVGAFTPLVAGTQYVRVTNATPAVSAVISVVFGIDG